jgi:hypothetical protein
LKFIPKGELTMANDNGDKIKIEPEEIAQEVRVVLTKEGKVALAGPLDNLPLIIKLLGQGIDIASQLVYQALEAALSKRIIPAITIPPEFLRKP